MSRVTSITSVTDYAAKLRAEDGQLTDEVLGIKKDDFHWIFLCRVNYLSQKNVEHIVYQNIQTTINCPDPFLRLSKFL